MKQTLTSLVCALLALSVLACGAARSGTGRAGAQGAPSATLPKIETKGDPDDDSDRYPKQTADVDEVPYYKTEPFGHPADPADARAASALVRNYYFDAAHGDAPAACRLLYSTREEPMTGEDQARGLHLRSPAAACAVVLSELFGEQRAALRAQDATLKMGAVRTEYNRASVQMYFGRPPVANYIEAHRERGVWKLEMVLAIDRPVGVE
jgi:hypothetical protein